MTNSEAAEIHGAFAGIRRRLATSRNARRVPVVAAFVILGVVLAIAVFGTSLSPHDPTVSLTVPNRQPGGSFPLGTDSLGRDVLSRIMAGTRYTVALAFGATLFALLIGIVLGSVAGYFGGWIDIVVSRVIEMFLTVPHLIFAILLVAFLGNAWWVVIVVLGLTMWPATARLARSEALRLRDREFVEASRIAGVGTAGVIARHVLPNGLGPVIANASLQVAEAVLLSAGLSFIGLGDPSAISWGKMIQEAQGAFQTAWWAVVYPGLALTILLLSLHTIGDWVGRVLGKEDEGVIA